MRIKTFALCTASFAALTIAAPAAAQEQQGSVDPNAQAQTNPADQEPTTAETDATTDANGETIVVTGLRRSLQSAQNIRRNSEQIVDAIVAEDIGKLPDLNTAQTAARIPGVQVYRQGGEAQNVLVRGLPNFTTTYNGREIFTAETRVVALQDFPSSNIAALEVFKTSSAELVEPGLAGLVNVRSRRPFDFRGSQLAGSAWGLYTREANELSPNFDLLGTTRFDTPIGEIGVLVNISRTELQYLDSEPSNTDFLATPTINGQGVRFPDIQRLFYRSGNRVRPSANVAVQWRASDALQFYAEGLYQGFRNKIDDRLIAVPLYGGGAYSNLVFRSGTNLLQSGTITGLADPIFTFQGGTFNKTDTTQFAVGGIFDGGPLRVTVDLARTNSTFRGSTESVDRIFAGQPTTIVDFDLERPRFTIRGFDAANPANYLFDGLYEENQRSQGDDYQGRIDATYEFGGDLLDSLQVGVRGTTRDAVREFGNRFAGFRGQNIPSSSLPLDFQLTNPGFGPTNGAGGFSFLSPTYKSIRSNLSALRQFVIGRGATNYSLTAVPRNLLYTADEDTLAGYAQLNLGNSNLGGTVGIRALRVETRVRGPVPTGVEAIDEGSTNTEYLPNASIRARVMRDVQLRAAVSKTVTRPNFADLNPGATLIRPVGGGLVGTPNDPYVLSGGNPFLQPFTSWNFDAAVEYYFGRTSFVSITPFHRRIGGFIQQSSEPFTDSTLGTIRIDGPINTGKGRISGVELQGQTFFDFESLPDWARGFGVQANVTYMDAKTEQDSSNDPGLQLTLQPITDQLNGVSKWNYNLVGIYERYGFSARLSYNGRSSFRATQQFRGDDIYVERARPADRLDLSLNYNLTDRFTVFGDWTNITRTPFRQDFSSARGGAPRAEYVRYLRYDESTVSLGVRFRFGD